MAINRPEVGAGVAEVDLSGATVLVTGATDGIGRETALALGRLGATVLVHGRDRAKGEAVVERLRGAGTDAALHLADFADQGDVRDLASAVRADRDRLGVLVNNAGAIFPAGGCTTDGVERTVAVNHLAPFLLTNLLWPLVRGARVVTVASNVHRLARMDFRSLRTPGEGGLAAYARSKLANLLFTRELARRFEGLGTGGTATALHPGVVPGSSVGREYPPSLRAPIQVASRIPGVSDAFSSVAEAAETPVYLAAVPDPPENGGYYADCRPVTPSRRARDDRTARRLWRVSAELAGFDGSGGPRVPDPGD
ncbi:short-chain dehydrogenase [Halobacteriales archaeon QS_8_69_26]|nr:MAG: short-chain dehydrogenase [Halobacteriales archaeon QS_8_69_26]